MPRVASVLVAIALIYFGAVASLRLFETDLIFPADRLVNADPGAAGLAYEEVELHPEPGVRLHAWFVPATNARATVLFCHGNGGDIGDRISRLLFFNRLGLNSFIFDYRGYGRSTGSPDEAGVYRDARSAWDYLVERRAIAPERLILAGRSLGAAVAIELATHTDPAGLWVESSFSSMQDLAGELYPWVPIRLIMGSEFASHSRLTQLDLPTLVAHSPDDQLIPFAHGQRLAETAGVELVQLWGGHNSARHLHEPDYMDAAKRFVSAALKGG